MLASLILSQSLKYCAQGYTWEQALRWSFHQHTGHLSISQATALWDILSNSTVKIVR